MTSPECVHLCLSASQNANSDLNSSVDNVTHWMVRCDRTVQRVNYQII